MASIVISGDTSGAVTLSAPAISGTTTLTLPTTSGTLVVTGGAQTVQFAAGSAAAPSITFTGDTNTGIFSPAADTIAFSEGGVESMRIDASGNVGIGTTSPTRRLDVETAGNGVIVRASAGNAYIQLAPVFGTGASYIDFTASGSSAQDARISSGNGSVSNLIFSTGGASLAERMRIDSSGNVGIGTSSPGLRLDVSASQPTRGVIAILTNSFSATKTGSQMVFSQAGLDNWAIGMPGGSSSAFVLWNGRSSSGDGTEFLRVNDVGNLVLRGGTATASGVGVTFPATQSASSDANTLDDYEEGTWTPNVGGNATYFNQSGQYVKVGRLVLAMFDMQINTIGTGATSAVLGLPFPAGGNTQGQAGSVSYWASAATGVAWPSIRVDIGATTLAIGGSAATNTTTAAASIALLGTNARLIGSICYYANA